MTRIFAIALPLFIACADKDGGDSGATEGFAGGTFQFTTNAVTDSCMDGAFEVIFMPEGTANAWATTTELPATEDLPVSYQIEIQQPFSAMDVTVSDGGENVLTVGDAAQSGVELDADSWPGCLVDMDISATLNIISDSEVRGSAVLTTSSFDEDSCPAVSSDPCTITLDLTGTLTN